MKNGIPVQGVLSLLALLCLAVGWFNLFSPEINNLLYNKVFYILIGLSFALVARNYPKPMFTYIAYAAAALCIIGPFLPGNLQAVKTIGLFAGVILTFFSRGSRA